MSIQLSIIIPTLNEEECLPLLLKSIKKQKFSDYELIVADTDSKDKTVKIAKRHGAKIVAGGLPAKAKNNGAKAAKGDLILFLDADCILPDDFLGNSLNEFDKRKLKIAGFLMKPQTKNRIFYLIFNLFYNWPILFWERLLPHAAMGILIERKLFKEIKGFDKTIKIAEDHDLARRAGKLGKFGILRSTILFVSDRRFKQDGWIRTYVKYFLCELHMIFLGPIRNDTFKYEFDHYSQDGEN